MTMTQERMIASVMLDVFEQELYNRMLEDEDNYIRECILDSVSPVACIVCDNLRLYVNMDDYGMNEVIRTIHRCECESDSVVSVFMDGKDIFDMY